MVEDYTGDIIAALLVVGLKGARAPSEWTQTLEDLNEALQRSGLLLTATKDRTCLLG